MEGSWRSAKPSKKTQAEKRNEKRMRDSYFTQNYEAYGEFFSNFKTAQDIRKESFRIFKSLVNGAIDLSKHANCFADPEFVGVLKDVAQEKMLYHYATQMGLEIFINSQLAYNNHVEGFIYEAYSNHQMSTQCYTLLYQAFENIQITHDYNTVLSILLPKLSLYRNAL